jgi:hypothetical protein
MLTLSVHLRSFLVTTVLVSSGLLQLTLAVPSDTCGSVERLKAALHFAEILDPELKDREFSLSLAPGNGTFVSGGTDIDDVRIRFDRPIWKAPADIPVQREAAKSLGAALPFYISFSFIEVHSQDKTRRLACHPVKFTSEISNEAVQNLLTFLNSHPEWSDDKELEMARKAGLRYGPEENNAVLGLIPLKELEQFYGPLEIKDARFSVNAGTKCPGCSFAGPAWYLSVSQSNTGRGLLIVVDPFSGRITSLSE